ncbi:hypothetical protein Q7M76_04025 [Candidatus Liberibacter asiaticus]|uniref:Uncharacterized protein n=2 Tax=Liberibacter asiaticus TaxID=34021 RepID=C6XG96_LIBAP|nr:hypothetical protein [Candidatus Liberibacter asiaticus]ACT57399.1 hypothetical protein CLIBASIA_04125 [Candidatus Liberibacter asiaticus str. psy62]AGH17162.1 hypothetical protein WSI_03960 [Candidatus Liberibacter asiaticus str. gxpsy]KAE9509891.1 hypothetical protein FXW22_03965 [Candidatus Liberibacter asiaticus]KAE9510659.1 hypothetical protein FXW31_05520 [Candidatus Liberibacter asiaticus]KAE9512022.1 hypothetical protein FXW32_03900 [Candidatus Liberibacter asiaticus]
MKIGSNQDDNDDFACGRKKIDAQEERKIRLASMLRKNLHRRKGQARLKN